jgi:hypothetical protein
MGKFVYFAYEFRISNSYYNNASFDNSNSNNEKIQYRPIDSIIHIFLDVSKIMDYENIMYFIAPSQNFHPLGLFKDNISKIKKFPTLFYWQPRQFSKGFSYQ